MNIKYLKVVNVFLRSGASHKEAQAELHHALTVLSSNGADFTVTDILGNEDKYICNAVVGSSTRISILSMPKAESQLKAIDEIIDALNESDYFMVRTETENAIKKEKEEEIKEEPQE